MPKSTTLAGTRAAARRFEEALPSERRKRLGQYFTGVRLGKLLAHLALVSDMKTVVDPMAGHGDLIDATAETANDLGIELERLDGIEIDPETARACRERLHEVGCQPTIICGDAFNIATHVELGRHRYDLAIANPPYVRYQSRNSAPDSVRLGLQGIIMGEPSGAEKAIWSALASGYSGLADLSVPSWLLIALLVRPGGKIAIVAPATWRSRNYADVIRYLLLRCFALECVVEDTQPGWFSDALVRTHLIVARRLSSQAAERKLKERAEWGSASWVSIAPEAADERSLVGAAFAGEVPEVQFSDWLRAGAATTRRGIVSRQFSLHDEWISLRAKGTRRPWLQALEGSAGELPLFSAGAHSPEPTVPDTIRDLVAGAAPLSLKTPGEMGIQIGQGLRTGCNRFFYVDARSETVGGMVSIKVSAAYQSREFSVPAEALRPVLRRQTEMPMISSGEVPRGRVLDLRHWVLPEDAKVAALAEATYRKCGEPLPQVMPADLAAYVSLATQSPLGEAEGGKSAAELSAVRTNVRAHREGIATPRFWYMLPDFMPRHLPDAFVPRIVNNAPRVECNLEKRILIDANFSTFWTDDTWPRSALRALLNSTWCQLAMEALGTPMGGGALKLEATHLKQMPLPAMPLERRLELDKVASVHVRGKAASLADIDAIVLEAVLGQPATKDIVRAMTDRLQSLRHSRLRISA